MHFRFIFLTLAGGLALTALAVPLRAQDASGGRDPQGGQSAAVQAGQGPQTPAKRPSADQSGSRAADEQTGTAEPPAESISGTVTDTDGDAVPDASIVLEGSSPADRRAVTANDEGAFEFRNLKPGLPYHVTISAKGFSSWSSPTIVLTPGEYRFLTETRLTIEGGVTSVTVSSSTQDIAIEEVKVEEQQRVLGFIPNYYVVYGKDAAPLTKKLKFELAYKVAVNPVNFLGVAIMAGINQAGDTPDDVLGARGYGERVGTVYADGLTDIMFGGAILPSLLHQDPRYFYQGTGTKKSRLFHALSSPFVCKGDNGQWQPNYSTMGGDVISSAISNAYYPESNRGAKPMFESIGINTAERTFSGVMQEFVLRRLTPRAKRSE